jgi:DNA polymerase-3 subunit chi
MTRIDFYFNAGDKNEFACRIAAKAFRQDLSVAVFAPDENRARSVDHLLWLAPATGFVPHCRSTSPLAAETPVVIAMTAEALPEAQVLVNLDSQPPAVFGRFQRVIEIVSEDEADKLAARARYRFYRDQGYEIVNHDLAKDAT